MDTDEHTNGNDGPRSESTLVLTLDRKTFTLKIGGHTENFDEALAMCDLARRVLEGKIRAAQVSSALAAPAGAAVAPFPMRRH